jgi:hypothetical protein
MESTASIWDIVECEELFEPWNSVNQISGKFLRFDVFEDTEDGTFPRVQDYTRLVKAMDSEGIEAYLRWIGKSKMKFNAGYCRVVRDNRWGGDAYLLFDKPIKMIVAEVNETPIIAEVNKIYGEFTYEWYWLRKGRQEVYANGCNIYFDCKKFWNV